MKKTGSSSLPFYLFKGRRTSGALWLSWNSSTSISDGDSAEAVVAASKQNLHDPRSDHGERGPHTGVARGQSEVRGRQPLTRFTKCLRPAAEMVADVRPGKQVH